MKPISLLLLAILLAPALPARADQVTDAINAAYSAAQAAPARVAPAAIAGASHWTIQTDLYTSPQGSGFIVSARLALGAAAPALVHQSGPQTAREHLPALAAFKAAVVAALRAQYQAALAQGITANGLTLKADPASQAQFTGLFALMPSENPSPATLIIIDLGGAPHVLSYGQAYALLVAYGQQLYTLQTTLANQISTVQAAGTFDALSP
jgi:hypothetical protein